MFAAALAVPIKNKAAETGLPEIAQPVVKEQSGDFKRKRKR